MLYDSGLRNKSRQKDVIIIGKDVEVEPASRTSAGLENSTGVVKQPQQQFLPPGLPHFDVVVIQEVLLALSGDVDRPLLLPKLVFSL